MKTIAFFNNKGGVGKTTLVYHLAWMFSQLGIRTLAVDLDPQANLTSMFLREGRLEELWPDDAHPNTIYGAISPLLKGTGDIAKPHVEILVNQSHKFLGLIPGDLGLSGFEDYLSAAWPNCQLSREDAFRTMTAFYRIIYQAAELERIDLVLIDVGPNLGAINRSALIATDQVVLPLAPDLFSLQGLKNLGPTLAQWRTTWKELIPKTPKDIPIPQGMMQPVGYVIMQHGMRDNRPVKAYERWMNKIPAIYRDVLIAGHGQSTLPAVTLDENNLALLKHYRSLMPLAMEANKPMFSLKPSDGAIGAHVEAVALCYKDFKKLAMVIGKNAGLSF